MTDTKHPADVLADKCALIGSNPALWSQQAATMLRTIPALEADRDLWADRAASRTDDWHAALAERDEARKALALVQQHHTTAWNRGHEAGMRAARDQITKAREAVKADAWWNSQLTEALMAAEAERDNVRSINARISEEMGQLRAEFAALKAQAAQPHPQPERSMALDYLHQKVAGTLRDLPSAPQAAQPLTALQVYDLDWPADVGGFDDVYAIVRQVERAHGIGKEGGAA